MYKDCHTRGEVQDRLGLLLGPFDDEDRAFAVLRAVVADASQERPAKC